MNDATKSKTHYNPGRVAGLEVSVEPLALAGSLILTILLLVIAVAVLALPIGSAILASLLAVLLHWVSALAHQFGHAWAARRTGHPMSGVRLGTLGLLGTSLYPPDEPELPAALHIRRALGGPTGSLVFSIVAAVVWLALARLNESLGWAGLFFFLDNFLVFGLGSFLPLGFTDGSTLLEWRNK